MAEKIFRVAFSLLAIVFCQQGDRTSPRRNRTDTIECLSLECRNNAREETCNIPMAIHSMERSFHYISWGVNFHDFIQSLIKNQCQQQLKTTENNMREWKNDQSSMSLHLQSNFIKCHLYKTPEEKQENSDNIKEITIKVTEVNSEGRSKLKCREEKSFLKADMEIPSECMLTYVDENSEKCQADYIEVAVHIKEKQIINLKLVWFMTPGVIPEDETILVSEKRSKLVSCPDVGHCVKEMPNEEIRKQMIILSNKMKPKIRCNGLGKINQTLIKTTETEDGLLKKTWNISFMKAEEQNFDSHVNVTFGQKSHGFTQKIIFKINGKNPPELKISVSTEPMEVEPCDFEEVAKTLDSSVDTISSRAPLHFLILKKIRGACFKQFMKKTGITTGFDSLHCAHMHQKPEAMADKEYYMKIPCANQNNMKINSDQNARGTDDTSSASSPDVEREEKISKGIGVERITAESLQVFVGSTNDGRLKCSDMDEVLKVEDEIKSKCKIMYQANEKIDMCNIDYMKVYIKFNDVKWEMKLLWLNLITDTISKEVDINGHYISKDLMIPDTETCKSKFGTIKDPAIQEKLKFNLVNVKPNIFCKTIGRSPYLMPLYLQMKGNMKEFKFIVNRTAVSSFMYNIYINISFPKIMNKTKYRYHLKTKRPSTGIRNGCNLTEAIKQMDNTFGLIIDKSNLHYSVVNMIKKRTTEYCKEQMMEAYNKRRENSNKRVKRQVTEERPSFIKCSDKVQMYEANNKKQEMSPTIAEDEPLIFQDPKKFITIKVVDNGNKKVKCSDNENILQNGDIISLKCNIVMLQRLTKDLKCRAGYLKIEVMMKGFPVIHMIMFQFDPRLEWETKMNDVSKGEDHISISSTDISLCLNQIENPNLKEEMLSVLQREKTEMRCIGGGHLEVTHENPSTVQQGLTLNVKFIPSEGQKLDSSVIANYPLKGLNLMKKYVFKMNKIPNGNGNGCNLTEAIKQMDNTFGSIIDKKNLHYLIINMVKKRTTEYCKKQMMEAYNKRKEDSNRRVRRESEIERPSIIKCNDKVQMYEANNNNQKMPPTIAEDEPLIFQDPEKFITIEVVDNGNKILKCADNENILQNRDIIGPQCDVVMLQRLTRDLRCRAGYLKIEVMMKGFPVIHMTMFQFDPRLEWQTKMHDVFKGEDHISISSTDISLCLNQIEDFNLKEEMVSLLHRERPKIRCIGGGHLEVTHAYPSTVQKGLTWNAKFIPSEDQKLDTSVIANYPLKGLDLMKKYVFKMNKIPKPRSFCNIEEVLKSIERPFVIIKKGISLKDLIVNLTIHKCMQQHVPVHTKEKDSQIDSHEYEMKCNLHNPRKPRKNLDDKMIEDRYIGYFKRNLRQYFEKMSISVTSGNVEHLECLPGHSLSESSTSDAKINAYCPLTYVNGDSHCEAESIDVLIKKDNLMKKLKFLWIDPKINDHEKIIENPEEESATISFPDVSTCLAKISDSTLRNDLVSAMRHIIPKIKCNGKGTLKITHEEYGDADDETTLKNEWLVKFTPDDEQDFDTHMNVSFGLKGEVITQNYVFHVNGKSPMDHIIEKPTDICDMDAIIKFLIKSFHFIDHGKSIEERIIDIAMQKCIQQWMMSKKKADDITEAGEKMVKCRLNQQLRDHHSKMEHIRSKYDYLVNYFTKTFRFHIISNGEGNLQCSETLSDVSNMMMNTKCQLKYVGKMSPCEMETVIVKISTDAVSKEAKFLWLDPKIETTQTSIDASSGSPVKARVTTPDIRKCVMSINNEAIQKEMISIVNNVRPNIQCNGKGFLEITPVKAEEPKGGDILLKQWTVLFHQEKEQDMDSHMNVSFRAKDEGITQNYVFKVNGKSPNGNTKKIPEDYCKMEAILKFLSGSFHFFGSGNTVRKRIIYSAMHQCMKQWQRSDKPEQWKQSERKDMGENEPASKRQDQDGQQKNGQQQNGQERNGQQQESKGQDGQQQNGKRDGQQQDGQRQGGQHENDQQRDGQQSDSKGQNGQRQDGQQQDSKGQDGQQKNGQQQNGKRDGQQQDGQRQGGQHENGQQHDSQQSDSKGQNGQQQNGQQRNGQQEDGKRQDSQYEYGKRVVQCNLHKSTVDHFNNHIHDILWDDDESHHFKEKHEFLFDYFAKMFSITIKNKGQGKLQCLQKNSETSESDIRTIDADCYLRYVGDTKACPSETIDISISTEKYGSIRTKMLWFDPEYESTEMTTKVDGQSPAEIKVKVPDITRCVKSIADEDVRTEMISFINNIQPKWKCNGNGLLKIMDGPIPRLAQGAIFLKSWTVEFVPKSGQKFDSHLNVSFNVKDAGITNSYIFKVTGKSPIDYMNGMLYCQLEKIKNQFVALLKEIKGNFEDLKRKVILLIKKTEVLEPKIKDKLEDIIKDIDDEIALKMGLTTVMGMIKEFQESIRPVDWKDEKCEQHEDECNEAETIKMLDNSVAVITPYTPLYKIIQKKIGCKCLLQRMKRMGATIKDIDQDCSTITPQNLLNYPSNPTRIQCMSQRNENSKVDKEDSVSMGRDVNPTETYVDEPLNLFDDLKIYVGDVKDGVFKCSKTSMDIKSNTEIKPNCVIRYESKKNPVCQIDDISITLKWKDLKWRMKLLWFNINIGTKTTVFQEIKPNVVAMTAEMSKCKKYSEEIKKDVAIARQIKSIFDNMKPKITCWSEGKAFVVIHQFIEKTTKEKKWQLMLHRSASDDTSIIVSFPKMMNQVYAKYYYKSHPEKPSVECDMVKITRIMQNKIHIINHSQNLYTKIADIACKECTMLAKTQTNNRKTTEEEPKKQHTDSANSKRQEKGSNEQEQKGTQRQEDSSQERKKQRKRRAVNALHQRSSISRTKRESPPQIDPGLIGPSVMYPRGQNIQSRITKLTCHSNKILYNRMTQPTEERSVYPIYDKEQKCKQSFIENMKVQVKSAGNGMLSCGKTVLKKSAVIPRNCVLRYKNNNKCQFDSIRLLITYKIKETEKSYEMKFVWYNDQQLRYENVVQNLDLSFNDKPPQLSVGLLRLSTCIATVKEKSVRDELITKLKKLKPYVTCYGQGKVDLIETSKSIKEWIVKFKTEGDNQVNDAKVTISFYNGMNHAFDKSIFYKIKLPEQIMTSYNGFPNNQTLGLHSDFWRRIKHLHDATVCELQSVSNMVLQHKDKDGFVNVMKGESYPLDQNIKLIGFAEENAEMVCDLKYKNNKRQVVAVRFEPLKCSPQKLLNFKKYDKTVNAWCLYMENNYIVLCSNNSRESKSYKNFNLMLHQQRNRKIVKKCGLELSDDSESCENEERRHCQYFKHNSDCPSGIYNLTIQYNRGNIKKEIRYERELKINLPDKKMHIEKLEFLYTGSSDTLPSQRNILPLSFTVTAMEQVDMDLMCCMSYTEKGDERCMEHIHNKHIHNKVNSINFFTIKCLSSTHGQKELFLKLKTCGGKKTVYERKFKIKRCDDKTLEKVRIEEKSTDLTFKLIFRCPVYEKSNLRVVKIFKFRSSDKKLSFPIKFEDNTEKDVYDEVFQLIPPVKCGKILLETSETCMNAYFRSTRMNHCKMDVFDAKNLVSLISVENADKVMISREIFQDRKLLVKKVCSNKLRQKCEVEQEFDVKSFSLKILSGGDEKQCGQKYIVSVQTCNKENVKNIGINIYSRTENKKTLLRTIRNPVGNLDKDIKSNETQNLEMQGIMTMKDGSLVETNTLEITLSPCKFDIIVHAKSNICINMKTRFYKVGVTVIPIQGWKKKLESSMELNVQCNDIDCKNIIQLAENNQKIIFNLQNTDRQELKVTIQAVSMVNKYIYRTSAKTITINRRMDCGPVLDKCQHRSTRSTVTCQAYCSKDAHILKGFVSGEDRDEIKADKSTKAKMIKVCPSDNLLETSVVVQATNKETGDVKTINDTIIQTQLPICKMVVKYNPFNITINFENDINYETEKICYIQGRTEKKISSDILDMVLENVCVKSLAEKTLICKCIDVKDETNENRVREKIPDLDQNINFDNEINALEQSIKLNNLLDACPLATELIACARGSNKNSDGCTTNQGKTLIKTVESAIDMTSCFPSDQAKGADISIPEQEKTLWLSNYCIKSCDSDIPPQSCITSVLQQYQKESSQKSDTATTKKKRRRRRRDLDDVDVSCKNVNDGELTDINQVDAFYSIFDNLMYPLGGKEDTVSTFQSNLYTYQRSLCMAASLNLQTTTVDFSKITATCMFEKDVGKNIWVNENAEIELTDSDKYKLWSCSLNEDIVCESFYISVVTLSSDMANETSMIEPYAQGDYFGISLVSDVYIVDFVTPIEPYDVFCMASYTPYTLKIKLKVPVNENIKCHQWQDSAWSDTCTTTYEADSVICSCYFTGPIAVFEVEPVEPIAVYTTGTPTNTWKRAYTESHKTTDAKISHKPATTSMGNKDGDTRIFEFKIDGSYSDMLKQFSDSIEFSSHVCEQVRKILHSTTEKFRRCQIWPGSIMVKFEVTDSEKDLDHFEKKLHDMLENGELYIVDKNGKKLYGKEDSLKIDAEKKEKDGNEKEKRQSYVSLIIGLSVALIVIVAVVAAVMVKRHMIRKAQQQQSVSNEVPDSTYTKQPIENCIVYPDQPPTYEDTVHIEPLTKDMLPSSIGIQPPQYSTVTRADAPNEEPLEMTGAVAMDPIPIPIQQVSQGALRPVSGVSRKSFNFDDDDQKMPQIDD